MITFSLEKLNLNSFAKVLDVGCGSGRHTSFISEKINSFVVASDLFVEEVNIAEKRLLFQNSFFGLSLSGVRFCATDIFDLPFCNDFFDCIICCEVLEHLVDAEKAVCEIVRVLKPDGKIIVSVPRFLPEKICWILSEDYKGGEGKHVKLYRRNELISLFEDFGLKSLGNHHSHSFHTPFWILKCILGLRNNSYLIRKYHNFLVRYIMSGSKVFMLLEKLLNPLFGKSLVVYFRKIT